MAERPRRRVPWDNPAIFAVMGLLDFAIGAALLLFGWDRTARSNTFVHTTGFAVWGAVVAGQVAYWLVVAIPLWNDLVAGWRRVRPARTTIIVLGIVLTLALVALPTFSGATNIDWPLWGHNTKVRVVTLLGALGVGVPALLGIAIVERGAKQRGSSAFAVGDIAAAVEARSQIVRFLSIAGTVIGLAVLAAGALRKATVPSFVPDDAFPTEGVVLYGAFFTGLLLLVYVPAHIAVRRLGTRAAGKYFPLTDLPDPSSDAFKPWLDRRATLEGLLQLNGTASQQLQASVFILTPLISGVIATLLPKPT